MMAPSHGFAMTLLCMFVLFQEHGSNETSAPGMACAHVRDAFASLQRGQAWNGAIGHCSVLGSTVKNHVPPSKYKAGLT